MAAVALIGCGGSARRAQRDTCAVGPIVSSSVLLHPSLSVKAPGACLCTFPSDGGAPSRIRALGLLRAPCSTVG